MEWCFLLTLIVCFFCVHFHHSRVKNTKIKTQKYFIFLHFIGFIEQMILSTNRPLYEEEYFHGVLPREEVVRLLKNDGDFLVRETTRNEESQIVLSVCWNGHKHFIVQTTVEGHYRFEGPAFPSIQELIAHQHSCELPVTSRSGAVLKKPVHRERWELSNDDVILLDKIGRVSIGRRCSHWVSTFWSFVFLSSTGQLRRCVQGSIEIE